MSALQPWVWYALLSAIFAALTAILAKLGLKDVDSGLATAIRTVFILLITWGIALSRGVTSAIPSLSRNNWLFLMLSAVATGLSWLFYYRALQLGPVAQVSAIDRGSIVFTIILAFIFLKEPLTPKILIGGALVVCGMIVMVYK